MGMVEGAAWMDRGHTTDGASSQLPTPHLTSPLKGGRDELGERGVGVVGAWEGVGSCLRRNDGKGRGYGEGAAWMDRGQTTDGAGSQLPTPHLTSPLKGGRDELGERGVGVWEDVGSCLRRDDGSENRG